MEFGLEKQGNLSRVRLKQEGVLDIVKKRKQNWKQKVKEVPIVTSSRKAPDSGGDEAVSLISSSYTSKCMRYILPAPAYTGQ